MTHKTCCTCKQHLPVSDFYADKMRKDGLYARCKKCHCKIGAERVSAKRAAARAASEAARPAPEAIAEQRNARRRELYLANPEKYRARSRANRAANPEKINATVRAARAKRPSYMKQYLAAYYLKNTERIRANIKARVELLGPEVMRPKYAQQSMKRYAGKVSATPGWANMAAIKQFYVEAARITAETGTPHEVDHIVPLLSKRVCGLHVEHNLQILPKIANIKKGNRHWPDQPEG